MEYDKMVKPYSWLSVIHHNDIKDQWFKDLINRLRETYDITKDKLLVTNLGSTTIYQRNGPSDKIENSEIFEEYDLIHKIEVITAEQELDQYQTRESRLKLANEYHKYELDKRNSYELMEGGKKEISTNVYERSRVAREICLNHYRNKDGSLNCQICYKPIIAIGEIEVVDVHHDKPLHIRKEKYIVNPITDLIPCDPTCHRIADVLGTEKAREIV